MKYGIAHLPLSILLGLCVALGIGTAAADELAALRAQDRKPDTHPARKSFEAAKAALALATTNALTPSKDISAELEEFLAEDKLDGQLAKCVVLSEATPRELAEFPQRGKAEEALVEDFLANDALMKQMVVAGGAKKGKYGQTMQILTGIQKASPKAGEGVMQRLALGVSLDHAVPLARANAASETDAPTVVAPVKRCLHYEKAWLTLVPVK